MPNKKIEPKTVFETAGKLRPAFNRSIATLNLRTDANSPDDGYNIFVTATFGTQIVELQAGPTLFEVVFEI